MSFNSFRRRGHTASKSVIKASLSQISEAQRTLEDTCCLVEYHGIDEEDVQVLNNPASESKDDPSAISEDEVAKQPSYGGETNQQCTEVRSEEYAVLSDSTEEMEELERCYRGGSEVVLEPQSTSERIDDWCLTHVSCGTSTVLEAASSRVRDIARSWGVEGDERATLSAGTTRPPAVRPLPRVSSYESRKLAQLTPAELAQLTKFVKELLPYLIQGRASVRTPRCEAKYGNVPTLFPDRGNLLRCSLDANNVSKMANLYEQMRQLLLDAPSNGNYEALDDISLSSMHSSLPVQSWYGWHMVPRVRDTEF